MKKKLLFIVNDYNYFISHRLPIATAAREAGYEVHVATGIGPKKVTSEDFTYHPIHLSRKGRNIFVELMSILAIYRLLRSINPDIVHLVTIKPVLYGSIAAQLARVPAVVAAIPGLGYAFIEHHFEAKCIRTIVSVLYKIAFRHKNLKVIFQNSDDEQTLLNRGLLKKEQTVLIHGSGVDLNEYRYTPEPANDPPIVIMASRLLRDKGIIEYIEAGQLLRSKGSNARFWLAGSPDPGNPSSISEAELQAWIKAGDIEYVGHSSDIPTLFSQVNIVILPSYREGLPRVLAEAAACGRAIVTTEAPGCRAAIIHEKTGLLVKVRDTKSLASAIDKLLADTRMRQSMGIAGRELAESAFSLNKIVKEHLHLYQILSQPELTIAYDEVRS